MANEGREVRAAVLGLGLTLFYGAAVLATGRVDLGDFFALFSRYLRGALALWTFLGLAGLLLLQWRSWRRARFTESPLRVIRDWVADQWRSDYCLAVAWPPLMLAGLMASFNAFKQMVLPLAGFRFDPLFAGLDRALFLGHDPWRVTHALFGPAATAWIDAAYHGWFVPMTLGVILCAWLPRTTYRLRTQYLLSYMLVWIGVGSVLAFLLPAAGPCFYTLFVAPDAGFQQLLAQLAADQAAVGHRLAAMSNQKGLLGAFGTSDLVVGGGISAMPSVHNGLSTLFALAAFGINRKLGYVMAAYAVLIWIGSIHLGWHYAIDGLAAAALTIVIWRFAGRLAIRLERPAAADEPGWSGAPAAA